VSWTRETAIAAGVLLLITEVAAIARKPLDPSGTTSDAALPATPRPQLVPA
jgi:hypothetical protein